MSKKSKRKQKQRELMSSFFLFLGCVFLFTPVIPFAILVMGVWYLTHWKESYAIGAGFSGIFAILFFWKEAWLLFWKDVGAVFTELCQCLESRSTSFRLACVEVLPRD